MSFFNSSIWCSLVRLDNNASERTRISAISRIFCFSPTSAFMCEEMKLTRKVGLSMFFMAKLASEGILGEMLIIFSAKSLMEENNA